MTASTSRSLESGAQPRRRHIVGVGARPPEVLPAQPVALVQLAPETAPTPIASVEKTTNYVRWQRKPAPLVVAPLAPTVVSDSDLEESSADEDSSRAEDGQVIETVREAANETGPVSRTRVKPAKAVKPEKAVRAVRNTPRKASPRPAPVAAPLTLRAPPAPASRDAIKFRNAAVDLVLLHGVARAQELLDEVVARIRAAAIIA